MGNGLQVRVKNMVRIEKAKMYRWSDGKPSPTGMADVVNHIAHTLRITTDEVWTLMGKSKRDEFGGP